MNPRKLKIDNIKVYLLPLIGITIVFGIMGSIMLYSLEEHFNDRAREEYLNIASGYSLSLSKAAEAEEVVNELLAEKLSIAGNAVIREVAPFDDEFLKRTALLMEVDVIEIYNADGVIINATNADHLGWKAEKGHPVDNFFISDLNSYVGGVRQDSISKYYIKYGYFRMPLGGFVQVGVMADKVGSFLGNFEMQKLLSEIEGTNEVRVALFIDSENRIIGSTNADDVGNVIMDNEAIEAMQGDQEQGFVGHLFGERLYQVFVPVYYENQKIGTLGIGASMSKTDEIIRRFSYMGLLILFAIYMSALLMGKLSYNKDKKFMKLAYHDSLTGLPNQVYLREALAENLRKNKGKKKALLLVNCDNFKIINMILGYDYGDEILKEMGDKIKSIVEKDIMLFRLSADRFVLYIENYRDKSELTELSNKITELFIRPFRVKDTIKYLTIQVGITEIGDEEKSIDQMLKEASLSLSTVVESKSENYAFFDKNMDERMQRKEVIERELRQVIQGKDESAFYLEYQPLVTLKDRRIIGFEALARLRSKNLGMVSPVEFIGIAEHKHLIIPLGNIILKRACIFIRDLNLLGYDSIKVAVNISVLQLLKDDFTDVVKNIIKESGINASNLELEITESVIFENFDVINEKLKELKAVGIKIYLDDFGTGYSSLHRLKELQVDTLKIDRSFISHIRDEYDSTVIARDIISMAHRVGLTVVAEGVELESQKAYLLMNDCDIMQGYLFSHPLREEDAISILRENQDEGLLQHKR